MWRAAGVGVSCWFAALPARAAISAQIPAECGSTSEFEQQLEQRLGSVSSPETTRVMLTSEPSGYHLVVEAGSQRRELYDPSCQELLRAAVVITLALLEPKREEATPLAAEPERDTPPATPTPAGTVASPPPRPAAPLAPNAQGHSRPTFALGAGGGLHVGTLPKATLLLELDAQLEWTRFGVAAGFRYLLPTSTTDDAGRGVRISAPGAYVAGVFEPWPRVQARLGVAAYRLSAAGSGSQAPREGAAWELAPTLGASFTPFQRAPFWTRVGVEGQLNVLRPSFDVVEILNYHEVFRVPLLSGSAFAHAGVVF